MHIINTAFLMNTFFGNTGNGIKVSVSKKGSNDAYLCNFKSKGRQRKDYDQR